MGDASDTTNSIGLTAEIVSAYVSNNTVATADIPALINQVHTALAAGDERRGALPLRAAQAGSADQASINPDFIVCLEDGKKFKSLKRHLRTQYNMTPEQYREKWSLPARLSDGGAELRRCPLAAREADGPGSAAPPPALDLFR